jgi:signal transduction histidine kinase
LDRLDVTVDPGRIQQVLWNLLANAVKFTPRGGRISIQLRRNPRDITVVVADTGAGIEPTVLPYVFQRFRQGLTRGHSPDLGGGLGLGLALVRHFVELHGGHVRASSDGPGRGSTFVVTLPTPAGLSPR